MLNLPRWASQLVGTVAGVADRLTGSASTKALVNQFLGEYGHMLDLHIDNQNKTITASVLLKGESQPIQVRIAQYELVSQGTQPQVRIVAASCDRAWLDAVLQQFVVGKSFAVPPDKMAFLEAVLG